jgi:hypothetical protein
MNYTLILNTKMNKAFLYASVASQCALGLTTKATWFYNSERPLVIGHRGSLGYESPILTLF